MESKGDRARDSVPVNFLSSDEGPIKTQWVRISYIKTCIYAKTKTSNLKKRLSFSWSPCTVNLLRQHKCHEYSPYEGLTTFHPFAQKFTDLCLAGRRFRFSVVVTCRPDENGVGRRGDVSTTASNLEARQNLTSTRTVGTRWRLAVIALLLRRRLSLC